MWHSVIIDHPSFCLSFFVSAEVVKFSTQFVCICMFLCPSGNFSKKKMWIGFDQSLWEGGPWANEDI